MDTDHLPILDEVSQQKKRGVLLVLTGPSGSGKDAVLTKLQELLPQTIKIITTTSRAMRGKESEGHPYHFVSRERFEELIAEGAFFEWVEFRGEYYGTQKKTLTDALENGNDVIWKIEAKGVKNIKDKIKQMVPRVVFVFLTTDSIEMMRKRVEVDEGEEGAKTRFNEALVVWEMKQYEDCDYLVVNNDHGLDTTVSKIQAILEAKRLQVLPPHTAKELQK